VAEGNVGVTRAIALSGPLSSLFKRGWRGRKTERLWMSCYCNVSLGWKTRGTALTDSSEDIPNRKPPKWHLLKENIFTSAPHCMESGLLPGFLYCEQLAEKSGTCEVYSSRVYRAWNNLGHSQATELIALTSNSPW
jgi:hypothetical protein